MVFHFDPHPFPKKCCCFPVVSIHARNTTAPVCWTLPRHRRRRANADALPGRVPPWHLLKKWEESSWNHERNRKKWRKVIVIINDHQNQNQNHHHHPYSPHRHRHQHHPLQTKMNNSNHSISTLNDEQRWRKCQAPSLLARTRSGTLLCLNIGYPMVKLCSMTIPYHSIPDF